MSSAGSAGGASSPPPRSRAPSAAPPSRTPAAISAIAERPIGAGPRRRRAPRRRERRVVVEDLPFQCPQLRPGLEPQLLHAVQAALAIGVQRVSAAPAPVQGEHQLSAQPLVQRVRLDKRLEVGHDLVVAAEGQVGIDPLLDGHETQSFEPGDLVLREPLVDEVHERRAPPHLERLAQARQRLVRPPRGARALPVGDRPLEADDVDGLGRHLQHVAAGPGQERRPVRAGGAHELLAQLGDLDLQPLGGGSRRPAVPQLVDQAVGRDHLVAMQQQQRQERAALVAANGNFPTGVQDLQRSQQTKLQRCGLLWATLPRLVG